MSPRRVPVARRRARVLVPGFALGAAIVLGACGSGEDARDPAAFCERIRVAQPALTDATDPAALLALYQGLDPHTPLQIRDDWRQLTDLIRQVTTYDPTDPQAVEDVQKVVLRSQAAVTAVAVWARDTCQIQLGPIPATTPIGGTGDQLISDQPPDTSVTTDDLTDDRVSSDDTNVDTTDTGSADQSS